MSHPALRLNAIRQIHVYISVFIAPLLLFWAFTGSLQVFRIPDKAPNSALYKLASVHRNSTYEGRPARPAPKAPPAGAPAPAPAPEKAENPATFALKVFFGLASILFFVSTLLGLWMAFVYHRRRGLLLGLFLLGAAIPISLLIAAA